tara:strand:- start:157 stop:1380 length:1224 start_codon:yes stop_codon:yes gene_type:complete
MTSYIWGLVVKNCLDQSLIALMTEFVRNNVSRFILVPILFYFPLHDLSAQETATVIVDSGYAWTLRDLKVIQEIPAPTVTFRVFTITRDPSSGWVIGGDLRNGNTELVYVDRENRLIGPYTSVVGTSGLKYTCDTKKASIAAQRAESKFNACRSYFYTVDLVAKTTSLIVSCAFNLCKELNDWHPRFQPRLFKKTLVSSSLISQFETYFKNEERKLVGKHVAVSETRTDALLGEINLVNPAGLDLSALKLSLARLEKLSRDYNEHADFFLGHRHDLSLPFSIDNREIISMESQAVAKVETAVQRIDAVRSLLASNLYEMQAAERLIIRKVQNILKDHGYYKSSIDGVLGSGTNMAIKRLYDDTNTPFLESEGSEILQTIIASTLKPIGSCSKSVGDGPFLMCFSLSR